MTVAAIVLAGGRSVRFGRDKLAEPLDGRALLHHAIEAVRSVEEGIEVVVVAAPGATPDLPAGVRLVHDADAFEGPLAGLATGLRAIASGTDRVLLVGGDMPTLQPAVLRLLASRLTVASSAGLVLLEDDSGDPGAGPGGSRAGVRPLPAAMRRDAGLVAAEALLASGERRLRSLAGRLVTDVVASEAWRVLDPAASTLRDVDSPEDLPPLR